MEVRPHLVSANTRIRSDVLGVDVSIRLRQLNGRWLAVAEYAGEPEVGIGASPRQALAAALATLGERAATALMADPQLLGLRWRSADRRDAGGGRRTVDAGGLEVYDVCFAL